MVFSHWHHQQNTTISLPYIVNGGKPIVKNQEQTPPVGDIVLIIARMEELRETEVKKDSFHSFTQKRVN